MTISSEQLNQLKTLGKVEDECLVLLHLLSDYQGQTQSRYVLTSDLLEWDFDSEKLFSALSALKQNGAIDFQASSLTVTWANSSEEDRFDLSEIQSQLSADVLTEEQAFYYELLLQKPPGQSSQVVDVYNWTGLKNYTAVEITELAYEWSAKTTKFTASSDDWLVFWQKDFTSFLVGGSPMPPVTPPVTPPLAPPTSVTASLSPTGLLISGISNNGVLIENDYLILEIIRPDGIIDSPALNCVSGVMNYPFTPQAGTYNFKVKFTSGFLIADLGNFSL